MKITFPKGTKVVDAIALAKLLGGRLRVAK